MIKINKASFKTHKFGDMTSNVSERAEPKETKLGIYVGLEHLDPDCIHIKRRGRPSDVTGTKLRVYPGDIIFGKRRAYQRKAAIVDFDGICSAHAMVVRANPKVILPELLPFFMHSDAFMHRAVDVSEGSLSPTIKWKILANQEFKIPSLDDQKRIAGLLWAMDNYCESLRKNGLALNALKESQLKYYFSRTTLKHHKYSGLENSRCLKLEEICDLLTDGAHASPKSASLGLPMASVENMGDKEIDIKSCRLISESDFNQLVRNNCSPEKGDVLFSKDGTVGKTFVYNQKDKIVLLSSIAIIRLKKDAMDSTFCMYALQSSPFKLEVQRRMTGTALKRVVLKDIKKFVFPAPSIAIQREVVALLKLIDDTLEKNRETLSIFCGIQKQVINEAIT